MSDIILRLEVSKDAMQQISDLSKRSGAKDFSDLFRKSLATYELLIGVRNAGGTIVIHGGDGSERELEVP